MAPKRNLNPTGLGRAIINRRAQDARNTQSSGLERDSLYTTDIDPTDRLKSVTQERSLDEFLNTAQLAGTEFTAEKRNIKIVPTITDPRRNPHVLSEEDEASTLRKHEENKQRLRVPRRPPWTKGMAVSELERQEKDAFLDWRRGLAVLQEQDKFLLTPFERNLEVWRQLWRVLERSHLVVQIVDARNPLRFRCEDLEAYVLDIEGAEGEKDSGQGRRRNFLLINKADLLSAQQRCQWADHYDKQGVRYAFFSAKAAALQQASVEQSIAQQPETTPNEEPTSVVGEHENNGVDDQELASPTSEESGSESEGEFGDFDRSSEDLDPRAKILSVRELEELFLETGPDLSSFANSGKIPEKLTVGLVGYPNVGKSSTINALLGEKKVSVSATPGKTKHFQTIHLSSSIVLCDCPGLVFPQFATTKADLVCDGVLPIDQMREYTGPVSLVVRRLPREVLEAVYGLSIKTDAVEGGEEIITAENLLIAYAVGRGYTRAGQGNPDEARAARYILKDYVNAKLLFCHAPPGISDVAFNEQTHKLALVRAAGKKRAPVTRVKKDADTYVPAVTSVQGSSTRRVDPKIQALDREFFATNSSLAARPFVRGPKLDGSEFTRARVYPHQNSVADDGTVLDSGEARLASVLARVSIGKKSHKKGKRVKQRSGKGYD